MQLFADGFSTHHFQRLTVECLVSMCLSLFRSHSILLNIFLNCCRVRIRLWTQRRYRVHFVSEEFLFARLTLVRFSVEQSWRSSVELLLTSGTLEPYLRFRQAPERLIFKMPHSSSYNFLSLVSRVQFTVNVTIYVNGSVLFNHLAENIAWPVPTLAAPWFLKIGAGNYPGIGNAKAKFDDLRFFNRPISSSEALQYYQGCPLGTYDAGVWYDSLLCKCYTKS